MKTKSKTYPELFKDIEDLQQENQALKDLINTQIILNSHTQNKKILQSFEIIELKDKITNYKFDIAFLIIGIIIISIMSFVAIIK